MYNYGSILSRYAKLASVGNLLSFALSVTVYVFLAIGLYTLATRRGIKSAWLAWLPIGNMWIIGSLADHYRFVAENRVTKYRKILLGFTIAVAAVSIIVVPIAIYFLVMAFSYGFGGGYYDDSILKMTGLILLLFLLSMVLLVLAVILAVFEYISLHKIYKSCDPSNATVFTVLSVIFPFLIAFFVFSQRNKDLGLIPPSYYPPQYGQPYDQYGQPYGQNMPPYGG